MADFYAKSRQMQQFSLEVNVTINKNGCNSFWMMINPYLLKNGVKLKDFQGFHPSFRIRELVKSLHLAETREKYTKSGSAWPKPFSVDLLDEDHLAAVVMKKTHVKIKCQPSLKLTFSHLKIDG